MEVVLGIDIGGTFTKIGLVDRSGAIHFEDEISHPSMTPLKQFIDCSSPACDEEPGKMETSFILPGIGVGAPNGNYYNGYH